MERTAMILRPRSAGLGPSCFAAAALATNLISAAAAATPRMPHAPVNAASLAGSKPLLFVDTGSGGIDVYDVHKLQGGPIKTITRGLVGNQYDMTTDVAGNLYVVADDQGVEQDQYVAVYAPPYTGEPKKLSGVLF